MKKLYLFALSFVLLTCIPVYSSNSDIQPDKAVEKKYWEFIKERLFDENTVKALTYNDKILIEMENASSLDSVVVFNLLKELKYLIPSRRIGYYTEFGKTFDTIFHHSFLGAHYTKCERDNTPNLRLIFSKADSSSLPLLQSKINNGNQLAVTFHSEGRLGLENCTNIMLSDTISLSERKQYIEYAILRSLCCFKGDSGKAETFFKGSVFNSFAYNPVNTNFSNADKFLLKKLYAPDFQKQFRKFLAENYSWRYSIQFTTSKGYNEMRGYAFSIISALILFILFYQFFIRRKYKKIYLRYLMPALMAAISYIFVSAVFVFFTTNHDLNEYVIRSGMIFALTIVAIVLATLLYFLEKFLVKPTMPFLLQLVMKVFLLLVLFIVIFGFLSYRTGTGIEKFINFCIVGLAMAMGRGTMLFLKEVTESLVREKDVELSKLKELKAQAEVASLHARINPHFLYNSLNSIAGLAHSNPDKTEKMALLLSDLFRYTINRQSEQMSCIRDEVDMVRAYLEIEQIRFGDRMSFFIDVDKDMESKLIPRFIIQPLVENAIKHGISKMEGEGKISLSVHKTTEGLVIAVADNGPAFTDGLVSGYGLQSLYDLLKLSYGDKAEVNWQNEPEKMISVIIKSNL